MSKKPSQEDCTCERWPISGGRPDPGFEDVMRDVDVDYEAIDRAPPRS